MNKRTTKPEDLYRFEWPSHPTFSPNGKHVIYEITSARENTNDYETHLYLADSGGNTERKLTSDGTRNTQPLWAPDGKSIAFISNRAFGSQIWLLTLDSGEERCLTRFKHGISSIVWSPNGETIFGLVPVEQNGEVEVFPEDVQETEARNEINIRHKKWLEGAKRYNKPYYKNDGVGFQNLQVRQLVSIDVKTGEFKLLTNRKSHVSEPAVSPDGKNIVFVSTSAEDSGLYGGRIFSIPANGGEEKLLYNHADASSPSFSPDGKILAFFAQRHNHKHLFIIPVHGGAARCISENYPDTLTDMIFTDMRFLKSSLRPEWSSNGKYVFAIATHEGRNEIVRFEVEGEGKGSIVIGGDRTIFHYSFDGDQTFVLAYSTVDHPGKISVVRVEEEEVVECDRREPVQDFSIKEGSTIDEVRLDRCNDDLLAEIIVVKPEVFSYTSEDNWVIQGFVLKPANFGPGNKYPVILDIHGGPHSSFGYSYFHQMQLFAANGFAVVYLNPRGTSGFGEAFTNAVCGDYGGKDMKDLLNGLNEAVRRFDFLDGNNVAINGISYGGFMVNWLITHTNQFRAAVSEGCISNWVSMYGTSDIAPEFVEKEFLGKTDVDSLWKFSPLAYVEKVNTPLLLLHNEQDLRCPIEQAEQFYSQLKRRGGDVEFVRIPDSSHALLQIGKPAHRIERLNAILGFVTKGTVLVALK